MGDISSIFKKVFPCMNDGEKKKDNSDKKEPEQSNTKDLETETVKEEKEILKMKDEKLSTNFRLTEFTNSQTAKRHGIDNTPTKEAYENIKVLVNGLLQPLRSKIGEPITISSGYRSPEVNKRVGGAETSQHQSGQAADMVCGAMNNLELCEFIIEHFEFDQLILEFYDPDEGPHSGWVHVSYVKEGNRKEVLTAMRVDGKTKYFNGLRTEK